MAQSVSRPAARAHPANDRSTLYEEITNKIIAQLEAGRLPWVQPWGLSGVRAPLGLRRNAATGRAYSGIFNVDQCAGLPDDIAAPLQLAVDIGLILPQVEELIRATGADIRIGGDKAYYDVAGDYIRVPPPQACYEPVNWHRTSVHELSHWTGAPNRLARDLSGPFGSKQYIFEELCAEIACAYILSALGVVPTVRHADYVGAWIDLLADQNRAIVRAASAASRAADYLLAFRDRQAGTAGQQHGDVTRPRTDGGTCRRRFRPRSPSPNRRRVPEAEEGQGAS
jgi:antirestriction protein ArdC